MKRRNVLLTGAAVATTGLLYRLRGEPGEVTVTVWFSRGAARYDTLRERVRGTLRRALGEPFDAVDVRYGDEPITLPAEEGARVLTELWPQTVIRGVAGVGPVDGVSDVNLLVTDGDPTSDPAGYGMRRVAAITGARALSELPPSAPGAEVVEPSTPATVAQLLVHECGHALGLEHRHGSVRETDGAVVASPMIGRYAWSSTERGAGAGVIGACGQSYPTDTEGKRRLLSLRYGPCARRTLRGDA